MLSNIYAVSRLWYALVVVQALVNISKTSIDSAVSAINEMQVTDDPEAREIMSRYVLMKNYGDFHVLATVMCFFIEYGQHSYKEVMDINKQTPVSKMIDEATTGYRDVNNKSDDGENFSSQYGIGALEYFRVNSKTYHSYLCYPSQGLVSYLQIYDDLRCISMVDETFSDFRIGASAPGRQDRYNIHDLYKVGAKLSQIFHAIKRVVPKPQSIRFR